MNGSGPERRRNGVSWIRPDSAADGFSGWSSTDGGEESADSERKKWLGGNVGFELKKFINLFLVVWLL